MPKNLNVIVYVRGNEAQKQKEGILAKLDHKVVRIMIDSDSREMSAGNLNQIIEAKKAGQIDALAIAKPEAFTLDEERQKYFYQKLEEAGVEVLHVVSRK